MSLIKSESSDLRKLLDESNDWSLSLEEIKNEKDFETIESKSETEVNIKDDFNAYFVRTKSKHLSNKNINRGESFSDSSSESYSESFSSSEPE